jgi:hypothetical protein
MMQVLRHLGDKIIDIFHQLTEPMTFYKETATVVKAKPYVMLRFFTIWALISHILSRLRIFPVNTFVIGAFVLIGSIIIFWIYPGYYRQLWRLNETDVSKPEYEMTQNKYRYIVLLVILDIATHYLPILCLTTIPRNREEWIQSLGCLTGMLVVYFVIFGGESIWNLYNDILDPEKSILILEKNKMNI